MSNQQKKVMENKKGYSRFLPLGLSISVLATSAIGFFTNTPAAHATLVYQGQPNITVQTQYMAMIRNVASPRAAKFYDCMVSLEQDCILNIDAQAGIHISPSDNQNHLTIRFSGSEAPYDTCHIYTNMIQAQNGSFNNDSRCFYNR